jgi:tetratricopeptide (TPR) repeat protein
LNAGLAELNKGNVFDAIKLLKQAARRQSSSSAAFFYLSGLYTGMGRYASAHGFLEAAMKGSGPQGAHYHQLGMIRRNEGCRPEALAAFQLALKTGMGKDEAAVWRQIGDVHVDLLEFDKAAEAYENATRLHSGDAGAHIALGRLYLDRNDPQRAVSELRKALDLAPATGGVHASLGRAYRALGDLESAVSVLRKAVELDPSDQDSRYVLGQVLLTLGRNRDERGVLNDREGRRTMDEYQNLQERQARTNSLFETAIERAQSGDLDRAEAMLKESLRLAPRYAPALQALGIVLLNRGNPQGALETLQQALRSNPLNPDTYFTMGAAYLRTARLSEALDMTERALVLEEDARYQTQLGEIYSKMNRTAESHAAFQRGVELRSQPGYRPADPYSSEMRRRDDTATVTRICGYDADR